MDMNLAGMQGSWRHEHLGWVLESSTLWRQLRRYRAHGCDDSSCNDTLKELRRYFTHGVVNGSCDGRMMLSRDDNVLKWGRM